MTGIQWTGDNADEILRYAEPHAAVINTDGNPVIFSDDDTVLPVIMKRREWLYREAGYLFVVEDHARWAIDSLIQRAYGNGRLADHFAQKAIQSGVTAIHPFYTHGRYGYGDKVTWGGKAALIIGGSDDGTYIINVLDPRTVYSHSNYSHISGEDLTPGWPA